MLDAFGFNSPEQMPVVYHPSPAGLFVHGQKLLDLFNQYPPDNPVVFDFIPSLPPGTLDERGRYHEVRRDEWGTEWEYLIYGIQGHPQSYPFASWREAQEFEFPPSSCFVPSRAQVLEQRKDHLVFGGWISIFEKLHGLRPMDELLMDLATGDRDLLLFLDRMVEYWLSVVEALIEAGVDVITFGDDWGAQTYTLISPAMFRRIFKPRYAKLMDPIKNAGRKVFFHSCGFLGEIFDELVDLGIDGLWPQITLCENDPTFVDKCREHRITIYIHPDRQRLIPLGTPQEIENAIRDYAVRYHRLGGGGIFYIEIENDAPFENVEALVRSVHRYRNRDALLEKGKLLSA